jgi:LPXTG-motif cell wall-anchored protein
MKASSRLKRVVALAAASVFALLVVAPAGGVSAESPAALWPPTVTVTGQSIRIQGFITKSCTNQNTAVTIVVGSDSETIVPGPTGDLAIDSTFTFAGNIYSGTISLVGANGSPNCPVNGDTAISSLASPPQVVVTPTPETPAPTPETPAPTPAPAPAPAPAPVADTLPATGTTDYLLAIAVLMLSLGGVSILLGRSRAGVN